jgi:hypothetical protein
MDKTALLCSLSLLCLVGGHRSCGSPARAHAALVLLFALYRMASREKIVAAGDRHVRECSIHLLFRSLGLSLALSADVWTDSNKQQMHPTRWQLSGICVAAMFMIDDY